jgi:hypothetical protein
VLSLRLDERAPAWSNRGIGERKLAATTVPEGTDHRPEGQEELPMKESAMVLERARRQLSELASIAEELNRASDAFTKELATIEAELEKLNLGLEVMLPRPLMSGDWELEREDDGSETGKKIRLIDHICYGRYGPRWRLLVRMYKEYEDEAAEDELMDTTPLVQASRDLRIAAAERIGDLLELITSEAEESVDSLNKVMDKVPATKGVDEVPAPPNWNSYTHGVDDAGVVHALKRSNANETLCGARVVSTNFANGRVCAKCAQHVLAIREMTGR